MGGSKCLDAGKIDLCATASATYTHRAIHTYVDGTADIGDHVGKRRERNKLWHPGHAPYFGNPQG
jgi:hypothetical protein